MSVNYFNESHSTASKASDDIIEEIEYRVVSNKISELNNPVGDKIIESTTSGDIREGHFGIEDFTQMLLQNKNDAEAKYKNLRKK